MNFQRLTKKAENSGQSGVLSRSTCTVTRSTCKVGTETWVSVCSQWSTCTGPGRPAQAQVDLCSREVDLWANRRLRSFACLILFNPRIKSECDEILWEAWKWSKGCFGSLPGIYFTHFGSNLVKNTKTGAVFRLSVEVDNQVWLVADLRRFPCGKG